jgi:hemerythrin-like domain-containing protein
MSACRSKRSNNILSKEIVMRLTPTHTTIRVIQEEHDRLAAVIRSMQHFVRTIKETGKAPDLKVFRAMLLYISEYPERVHHPKEDRYLFEPLMRRTDAYTPTIAELEAQHGRGEAMVRDLEHALTRYELMGESAFPQFANLAENYVQFYFAHMRLEEEVILPGAQQALLEEDWAQADAAFAGNGEHAERRAYEKLFSLIANITPAPLGLGPAL